MTDMAPAAWPDVGPLSTPPPPPPGPLALDAPASLDAYWRAANYLSVEQIYRLDNPLLREPRRREHVRPRLLGH